MTVANSLSREQLYSVTAAITSICCRSHKQSYSLNFAATVKSSRTYKQSQVIIVTVAISLSCSHGSSSNNGPEGEKLLPIVAPRIL